MTYLRIYAGPDGVSHFEDVAVATTPTTVFPALPPLGVSAPLEATSLIFVVYPAGAAGWRCPPRRQFVIFCGDVEIEAGDGEVRRVPAGSPLLFEDTRGRGHDTRMLGAGETAAVFIHVDA